MDNEVDENKHHRENGPLGIFFHDLIEGILGDLV
jgi:hypothetical protein